MENENKTNLKDILGKIESSRIKMRPKIYFALKTATLAGVIAILFLFLIYLVSFIIFSLKVSGLWFLPGFGAQGLRALLMGLPWPLILLALAVMIAIEVFAERAPFVYRRPVLYSLAGVIIAVVIGSFIVGKTTLHPGLFKAQPHVMGNFYRGFAGPGINNVYRGVVVEISGEGFIFETPGGRRFGASPASGSFAKGSVLEGDNLILMGLRQQNVIRYDFLRKAPDDFRMFPKRGMRQMMRPGSL